jgi:hypothetical protein
MKKEHRVGIRINGEKLVLLDFRNMFARLAYALVDATPPEGDLYDLTGDLPGFNKAKHRAVTKEAFSALFFSSGQRWPARGPKGDPETPTFRHLMPRRASYPAFVQPVLKKHPALRKLLGNRQLGFTLMYHESEIMMRSLELLLDQDIVALGLHDGLLVAASNESQACRAMMEVSKEVVGVSLPFDRHPL